MDLLASEAHMLSDAPECGGLWSAQIWGKILHLKMIRQPLGSCKNREGFMCAFQIYENREGGSKDRHGGALGSGLLCVV